jgi:alkylhydroperoxidase family enzyme
MLTLLSAIVAIGCVLASVRRLMWTVAPTALDPAVLGQALSGRGESAWPALRRAAAGQPSLGWEHDLFGVFDAAVETDDERDALVHEQLLEHDWLAQRWARVPRVCASIATSAGFFFASLALVRGLSDPAGNVGTGAGGTGAPLISALNALAVGIAGTAFCAAVHVKARRLARARREATERLVDRLRTLP